MWRLLAQKARLALLQDPVAHSLSQSRWKPPKVTPSMDAMISNSLCPPAAATLPPPSLFPSVLLRFPPAPQLTFHLKEAFS
ncbi:unnamed protein product [Xyrichtys novacula]|uniref:Unnamed protein product n=1 Tax=Xyrichtys novacula TaxID=13765 RepID=A0AAV1FNY3_XYRNO|nr:unnamed protein product [Xyrichtys novacula]